MDVGDIADLRTETSQTFENHDGTRTTEFFSRPVFYRPHGTGDLVPVAVGFRATTVDGQVGTSDRAPVEVQVAKATSKTGFLTIIDAPYTITYGLPAASLAKATTAAPVLDGPAADYVDFLPGVDLRLLARADGAKSFFIWRSAPANPSISYVVDAPNLVLALEADGSISFRDAKGTLVGEMPRPYAVDSRPDPTLGSGIYTDKVSYSLGADGRTVTVSVDPAWLRTATYPVFVDPTWANAGSLDYGDAHIASNYPNSNYRDYQRPDSPYYHELWLGEDPSGTSGTSYVYLRWDLSSISGTTIDSATIDLYPYHQYYNAPTSTRTWIALVTSTWDENDPTWNNRPNSNATDQVSAPCVEAETCTFNVKAYTQDWANGTPNYGVKVWENGNGATYWKRLISAEQGGSHVEHMSVTYHDLSATPTTPAFSQALSWTFTAGGTAQAAYHARVVTAGTCSSASAVWDSGIVSSADTFAFPTGLSDRTSYLWCVQASDGGGWTAWVGGSFVFDALVSGPEPDRSSVPFGLGGGWGLDIGVHNGEARLSRSLYAIPSDGPVQGLDLAYGSRTVATPGLFGYGWTSNLTQSIWRNSPTAPTLIIWNRPDGGRSAFSGSGTTWTSVPGHFETLGYNGTSEYTLTQKDQTRLVFSATTGRLARIVDRFGKTLTFVWGSTSATVTAPAGQVTTLNYPAGSLVTSVVDPAGRTWGFHYSATTDLDTITEPDPDGVGPLLSPVTSMAYGSHLISTVTRARRTAAGGSDALIWAIGYDAGKATSVTSPEVASADRFSYGTRSATWQQVINATGPVYANTVITLDALGRPTDISAPEGVITHREYDAEGNVTRETTPSEDGDAEVIMGYDERGNVTRLEQVLERTPVLVSVVTVSTYNATNDLLTRTEADNDAGTRTVTLYTYDAAGHLTSENRNCTTVGVTILPEGQGGTCTGGGTQNASTNVITRYAYTANDQLESEQDARGFVTKHVYDSYGNEIAVIANCTSTGTTVPDPFSSCTTTGTGSGGTHGRQTNVVTTTAYDAGTPAGKLGLPTSATDALGRTTSYTYDALGRQLTEVLPGDASIPALTRTTAYDQSGNALTEAESWNPAGGTLQTRTTTHTYDREQRETTVVDPTQQTKTVTAYDPQDNTTRTTLTNVTGTLVATVTVRTYDTAGRLVSEGLAGATPTTATLTTLGSAHKIEPPDGTTRLLGNRLDGTALSVRRYASSDTQHTTPISTEATTYDTLGRELTTDDQDADTTADTTNTYDRLGRLSTSTSDGATTTYTYDRAGNQLTVTDPVGVLTTTSYDPLNRATLVVANDVASPTLPTEDITTLTFYDAKGNTIAVQDARHVTTRTILNVRDQASRTIANCTDSGTTPTTSPASCTGAGSHTNGANVLTDSTYDGQGNVTKTVSAVGLSGFEATTETAYDAAGRVQASKDALGTITRNVYNTIGQLTDTYVDCTTSGTTIPTDWAGCTGQGTANRVDGTYNLHTSYAYDEWGNQVTVTGPNDRVTTSVYDTQNRVIQTIDNDVASPALASEDIVTSFAYDDLGRQAAVVRENATGTGTVVSRTVFNPDDSVAQVIVNCTNSGTTPPSNPATCTGAGTKDAATNLVTTNTFDARDQLVQVETPDLSATTGGSTATVKTQYAYDDAGRLCRVVENATGSTNLAGLTHPCTDATQTAGTSTTNVSTRYTYDGAGNLATMFDAAGHTTTYGYDAVGHSTGRTDALGASLVWTYDDIGNRIYQRNRTDSVLINSVVWTYDPFGRILTRIADGATTAYTYDLAGNKLTAAAGGMTITATYDRLNRVLSVDDEDAGTTADTTYTYSLTNPAWTDPSGNYSAVLDKFDRAISLNDPAEGSTADYAWTYGTGGEALSSTAGNTNVTTQQFDAAGHLLDRDTKTGGTSRAHYVYTYNRAGQILSEAATVTGNGSNGTVTYGYDPLGQLVGSTLAGTTTAYGWDATTNRTSVQVGGGTATTTAYDAANRPTSGANPTAAYASDADGRLTARPNQTMTWDHLGRLTSVTTASGTVAYTYDPLDRLRTAQAPDGSRVRFRYTGLTTSAAQWWDDVAGTVTRSIGNGWTGERLLDWTSDPEDPDLRTYGTNAHHDVTWLADSTGAVSQSLRYDPWGSPRSTVPQDYTPFRFQGSWYDQPSDLSWVVTRWYAPSLGRFVSEDTLLGEPRDPDSRHLYAYAAGEPVGRWDPSGLRLLQVITIRIGDDYEWWKTSAQTAVNALVGWAVVPAGLALKRAVRVLAAMGVSRLSSEFVKVGGDYKNGDVIKLETYEHPSCFALITRRWNRKGFPTDLAQEVWMKERCRAANDVMLQLALGRPQALSLPFVRYYMCGGMINH